MILNRDSPDGLRPTTVAGLFNGCTAIPVTNKLFPGPGKGALSPVGP